VQSGGADSRKVQVILHPDRESYRIAESIRPKLEIQNQHEFPVEIVGGFEFDWERLAFLSPNAVHLVDPDGNDQMLPYERRGSLAGFGAPIVVEGRKAEWLYLPISSHLHLRQLGNYRFWLELFDSLGGLHSTNQISFQLMDIDSSFSPDLIGLQLEARSSSFAVNERMTVAAVFANKSQRAITFLRPQQDSFDGWVNPIYQFTIIDGQGRSLAMARRDGTMATPVYDESATFTVGPGERYSQDLILPLFPTMRNQGEYRVRLSYIVNERAIGKGGDVLDQIMNWEDGVFVGRVESNEQVFRLH
jgi:hypothetical protein